MEDTKKDINEQIIEADKLIKKIDQLKALLYNILKVPKNSPLHKALEEHIHNYQLKKVPQLMNFPKQLQAFSVVSERLYILRHSKIFNNILNAQNKANPPHRQLLIPQIVGVIPEISEDILVRNCERAFTVMQKEIMDFLCCKNVENDYKVYKIRDLLGNGVKKEEI